MQASNVPTKISVPFANSGAKQLIPIPSQVGIEAGRASYTDGFPPLTRTPIVAGGIPPFGTDMNGVLNAITEIERWGNAGGQYAYDSDFATAIGGYPKGALIARAGYDGYWQNTVDNNTSNPDTGGAGWEIFATGRLLNVRVITSTSVYTETHGTKSIVVELVGGGGSGSGSTSAGAGQASAGSSGAGGGYCRKRVTSGFSGVTVTIGAGGAAQAAGLAGVPGGTTSFGSICSATGGGGGALSAALSVFPNFAGVFPPGSGVNGDINGTGDLAAIALIFSASIQYVGASGGSIFGGSQTAGAAIANSGAGGYGNLSAESSAATAGWAGGSGLAIIWEYA